MRIPFLDLKPVYSELENELDSAYKRVISSGYYILGEEVELFEKEFAGYCGAKFCCGVGNGLDAIYLILKAYDIGNGDEVIVPSNTFIATWLSVSRTGATPVPVEPADNQYNIDPCKIESAINNRTRAIIPVHLYGHPAEMDTINAVAKKYNLVVIEDAAQAHGADYKNRKTGSLGDAAAFSFYPGKNLGAFGDAGAVLTDNKSVEEKVKILRNYGSSRKYHNSELGYNSRMDPLQAAFLRIKLKRLEEWNNIRKRIAGQYINSLADLDGIILPGVSDGCKSAWHLFVIRSRKRNELVCYLNNVGIETLIHYPIPPHGAECYSGQYNSVNLRIAETYAEEVLSLPIYPHLDNGNVEYIIGSLKKYHRK